MAAVRDDRKIKPANRERIAAVLRTDRGRAVLVCEARRRPRQASESRDIASRNVVAGKEPDL